MTRINAALAKQAQIIALESHGALAMPDDAKAARLAMIKARVRVAKVQAWQDAQGDA